MKSLFIALLFAAGIGTASANEITVTRAAQQSFQKAFNQARNVSWSKVDDLYKVSFTLDSRPVIAFYAGDGSLSAVTRYITQDQLPLVLQSDLKKYTENYVLQEIFEVNDENGTVYYSTLHATNKTIVLQSALNNWSIHKKVKR